MNEDVSSWPEWTALDGPDAAYQQWVCYHDRRTFYVVFDHAEEWEVEVEAYYYLMDHPETDSIYVYAETFKIRDDALAKCDELRTRFLDYLTESVL